MADRYQVSGMNLAAGGGKGIQERVAVVEADMIGRRSPAGQRIDIRKDLGTEGHMFLESRPCCRRICPPVVLAYAPHRFTLDALLKRVPKCR